MTRRMVLVALGLSLLVPSAKALECSTECPPGTRRASHEAFARGEAGIVFGEYCETYCEPTLTCTAPSIPRVTRTSYACEPLEGFSRIPRDNEVDFDFARAWDEDLLLNPPGTCDDDKHDEGEADVDCGGICLPATCDVGLRCSDDADCKFGVCANGLCGGFENVELLGDAVSWPAGAPKDVAVADLDGDGDADMVIATWNPHGVHLVYFEEGRPERVETVPLASGASSVNVRDDRGGVAITARVAHGHIWTRWLPDDGAGHEALANGPGYQAGAPAWLGAGTTPMLVTRRVQTAGLILLRFEGDGWVEDTVAGAAAFPASVRARVLTLPSKDDPLRDEVVVFDENAVRRIPRDANGTYLWDAPIDLGRGGDEAFVFASSPGGPLDSVGVWRSSEGLDLHVGIADNEGRVENLTDAEHRYFGPVAGDLDGRGGLDSGRLHQLDMRLSLDRADGTIALPRFEMPVRFDRIVPGRHDLAGHLLLVGDGHGGLMRRGTR